MAETVVGRTGWDTHGLSGVENHFDARLAGVDGSRTLEVDSRGRAVPGSARDETPAQDGTGVQLTLDTEPAVHDPTAACGGGHQAAAPRVATPS